MKKTLSFLWKWLILKPFGNKSFKQTLFMIITLAASAYMIYWIVTYRVEFSGFAVAIGLMDLAFLKLWLIDKFLLVNIDIIDELKEGNTAVAITLLGYCIVISVCLICAFTIFY